VAKIIEKKSLAEKIKQYKVEAPLIAEKAQPGQFVVIRICEEGERIPLTIAKKDPEKGTITLIVQEVGKTTTQMDNLDCGNEILDLMGPLGNPSEIEKFGTVICIGGGIGIAPVHPIAKALKEAGNKVISIIGAREEKLLFFIDEMDEASHELFITTDDGSMGRKGFVTNTLQDLIDEGVKIDRVIAIGPEIMMKAVADLTRRYEIKTIVSLNSIMIDGTGMCGGCRVEVGGETKFTCIDGPEFDGHQVDFEQLIQRQQAYKDEEEHSMEHYCKLHPEKDE